MTASAVGQTRYFVSAVAVLVVAFAPWSASAIPILGIDINGDIHSISTDDGSFSTLGSVGFQAHTLDRLLSAGQAIHMCRIQEISSFLPCQEHNRKSTSSRYRKAGAAENAA